MANDDPMAPVRAAYRGLGPAYRAKLDASRDVLLRALDASNAADDVVAAAHAAAYSHPSHAALDALEAAERAQADAMAAYLAAAAADTALNDAVWRSAGAMGASETEARVAGAWLEACADA